MSASAAPLAALKAAPFAAIPTTIVRSLVDAYPQGVPADHLLFQIYGGSSEPDTARGALSVQIGRVRTSIERFGWTIPRSKPGKGNTSIYRLEPCRD